MAAPAPGRPKSAADSLQVDLDTQRLLVRPRTADDLDAVVALNSDPDVMRFIAPPGDPSMTREAVAARSFRDVERGLGYWSVFAREQPDRFIGYVGLFPVPGHHERIELSYRFHVAAQGRGFAREAALALVAHGFSALSIDEIEIRTHPDNKASLTLASRLGFVRQSDQIGWWLGDPNFLCAVLTARRNVWSPPPLKA
jgi:RimJ/RimL family protein N-acetyltransferase